MLLDVAADEVRERRQVELEGESIVGRSHRRRRDRRGHERGDRHARRHRHPRQQRRRPADGPAPRDHGRELGPDVRRQRPGDVPHDPGRRRGRCATRSTGQVGGAARSSTWRAWAARSARPTRPTTRRRRRRSSRLTRVAAMELGAHGITVNCICPGYVLTEMGAATRTPEMVAAWSAKSPLGRLAEPERRRQDGAVPRLRRRRVLHRSGDERLRRDGDALMPIGDQHD